MRRPGLTIQLFFVLLALGAGLVLVMALATRWSVRYGIVEYIANLEEQRLEPLRDRLAEHWAKHGDWHEFHENPRHWRGLLFESLPARLTRNLENDATPGRQNNGEAREQNPRREPGERSEPVREALRQLERNSAPPGSVAGSNFPRSTARPRVPYDPSGLPGRVRLLDRQHQFVAGADFLPDDRPRLMRIEHQGKLVGWLSVSPPPIVKDNLANRFLKQQYFMLTVIAVLAMLVAGVVAILLGRRLLQPLHALAGAVRQLARGDNTARVHLPRRDELGDLGRDVNRLAEVLEQNETLRRAAMADISHELRTPIAVLRGNIEAMQDGVLPVDEQQLSTLHGAVSRLARLVDDLYDMALADTGALRCEQMPLDLAPLLNDALQSHRAAFEQAQLQLESDIRGPLPLDGDARRLRQIIDNLLQNCLRYTDAGGRVQVHAERKGGQIFLSVDDSAPGVSHDALHHLFERFFRAESSRNRHTGGAGLGLAIVHTLVQAHGGEVSAAHSALGGVQIRIQFPVSEDVT